MWDHSISALLALNFIMMALCVAVIALRFWSRGVILKGQYGLDDWTCLMAVIPILSLSCVGVFMAKHGLDSQAISDADLSRAAYAHVFKGFFACCILFSLGLTLTKLSTLAFYRRVFGHPRQHDLLTWTIPFFVALIVIIAWLIFGMFLVIFRCHPVSKAWERQLSGKCIPSISDYLLALTITNLFEDIILVVLPIPRILKLALRPRKKALVTILMVFSTSIPLICIGRLVTVIVLRGRLDSGLSYYIVPLAFWIVAEPSISLLAISLPSLFQLVQWGRKYGFRSLVTGRDDRLQARNSFYQRSVGSRFPDIMSHPLELAGNGTGHVTSSVQAETGISPKVSSPGSDDPLLTGASILTAPEVIHVKREVKIKYDQPGGDSNI